MSLKIGEAKTKPSIDLLTEWILESYRAVAPKKMLAELEGRRLEALAAPPKATAKKKKR